ncbi:MAG: Integrase catalytic region [Desulfotomaculum sp. 46_296]|nr:MAG: Integrase catalytic region [Desulfotomaculum sp. 46_296]
MRDQKKADEIATKRVQLLLPLLDQGLDTARAKQIKAGICAQSGVSERTLRRYLAQYQAEGFNGLKPKSKKHQSSGETIPPFLLEQAIMLRRQVPGRSIAQIIKILEWEGLAKPGQIKRSTLQEKLVERGYSARQMRMYAGTGVAARRFLKAVPQPACSFGLSRVLCYPDFQMRDVNNRLKPGRFCNCAHPKVGIKILAPPLINSNNKNTDFGLNFNIGGLLICKFRWNESSSVY